MAKSDDGILNVALHGQMYLVLFVVPVKCDPRYCVPSQLVLICNLA
jgi:hypothetical protein